MPLLEREQFLATLAADHYVNPNRTKTFCTYDAATPEAIRKAAKQNSVPVDNVIEVTVLDPCFYHS